MNDNYKWNGVKLNSKGIIVEKVPIVSRAKHSFTTYEIPGRDGFLTIDNKTYSSIPFKLECHFKDGADINEIRSFLDGYGTLQIDSEKVYTGYISNSIDFEKIVNFKKFIIQFMLQPIARALNATNVSSTSSTTFSSNTYTNSYPIITIQGSGNVTIALNDKSFTIYDMTTGEYKLDCGAKVITKGGVNKSGDMSGDFPYVKNGTNTLTITGSVSALTISYYKTYL